MINWLYENDKNYLKKLENKNKITKKVFKKWYTEPYKGEVRRILESWLIEKEIYGAIIQYPHRNELFRIIEKIKREHFLTYPASKNHAQEAWKGERAPEIIRKKNDNLMKNKHFLGFYIEGKIPVQIKKLLKEKYNDKMIYNGKSIEPISSL